MNNERMGFAQIKEEMFRYANARYAPYYYSEELGFYVDEFYWEESAQVWVDRYARETQMTDEELDDFIASIETGLIQFDEIDLRGFSYAEAGFSDFGDTFQKSHKSLFERVDEFFDLMSDFYLEVYEPLEELYEQMKAPDDGPMFKMG